MSKIAEEMDAASEMIARLTIGTNNIAVLSPIVPSLQSLFEYRQRSFQADGKCGYTEQVNECTLCDLSDDEVIFSAGLVPRVVRHLEDEGYRVEVDDRRLATPSLTPDLDLLDTLEPRECDLLQAVRQYPLGQIEVVDQHDALEVCGNICRLFSKARVLVVLPNRELAARYAAHLPTELCERVALFMGGVARKECRCTVAVGQSMPVDGTWDVVILPNGENSVGDEVRARIGGHNFFAGRRYAFIRPGVNRDRIAALHLEQIAGEIIHHVARPRLAVKVVMLPTPYCRIGKAETPLTRKRTRYWANKRRNEFVAQVAAMLTTDTAATLLELVGKKPSVTALTGGEELRVVVLVESAEHLRHLAELLPTWKLLAGNEEALKGRPSNLSSPHVIMTAVYAAKVGYDAHIVIRATGGSGMLRIKGFPNTTEAAPNRRSALVVDLDDQFHLFVVKDTQRRRQSYERLGIDVREVTTTQIKS